MKKILSISEKNLLVLIIVGSVLVRLLASIILGNQVTQMPGIADQLTYHTLAQRVMNGFGFTFDQAWWPATHAGDPTAHWSYIYTFYLVFVYKLFGVNALLARIIQAIIIGILQPLLLYKISKIIFPEISGLFSAGWIAI